MHVTGAKAIGDKAMGFVLKISFVPRMYTEIQEDTIVPYDLGDMDRYTDESVGKIRESFEMKKKKSLPIKLTL